MSKNVALLLVLVFLTASNLMAKPVFSSTASTNVTENTWITKTPMHQARGFLEAAAESGKIYTIGGRTVTGTPQHSTGGVVGTNEEYDPATNKWTYKTSMPTPREKFAIATYQNKIYCIGGYAPDGSATGVNEVYDPATDTWATKASLPNPRYGVKANVVAGKIYLIGGYVGNASSGYTYLSRNDVYDPATDSWTTRAAMPTAVSSVVSAVVGSKIYVIMSGLNQIYDAETDTWSVGTPLPSSSMLYARAGATTGVNASKRIYVFGVNATVVYDPLNDEWANAATVTTYREGGFGVATVNDVLYVIGGYTATYPDILSLSMGAYVTPEASAHVTFSSWLETAKQKWGTHFLGVYYSDEAGGKMLDDNVEFRNATTGDSIQKTKYGDVVFKKSDGVVIHYEIGGIIHLSEPTDENNVSPAYATFYPNGTITGQRSSSSSYETYQDLMNVKQFKNTDDVAETFLARNQNTIEYLKNSSINVFTSDYALLWWDYLSGYDAVLAHIGWNLTLTQQISLVRGAAKQQNKDWGIVITWEYTKEPYLDTGPEILSQMRTAYEAGAKYFVVFNYAEEGNPYGTMKDEHFQALQDFWNNVVKNPDINRGSNKADSVLVLPKNYAWGMRWREDNIWGVFKANDQTQQFWELMQTTLQNHGLKTDIVYEDPEYPLTEGYQNIYLWTQAVK